MASKLKRVSDETERQVAELAEREGRTFVAQLDRVVAAGMEKLGETKPKRNLKASTAGTAKG